MHKEALAAHLCAKVDDIEKLDYDHYGLPVFKYESEEYAVGTDEEADKAAEEDIKNSLWAFRSEFIIDHSNLPYEALEMIQSFQEKKCESANETIEALITDLDTFVRDAINTDGRGHFLSSYDGEEHEETSDEVTYYIYRT